MKTKLFTLLLAVAASVGTIYASYKKVNGIWYEFDSSTKTATVTYEGSDYDSYSNEYTGSVVIPASVTYNDEEYSVTSIGERAFSGCTGLTSLTIGNSVTSIGIGAFSSCRGLTSVTIGNSVTSIGDYAFYNCSGLTSVHISDIAAWCAISFASSDANPLHYARNLYFNDELITNLVIPDNVTSIGDGAFRNCRSLTSVTIPNSVTSIGNDAFYNCSGLTSVHISDIAAWCAISFASSDANPLYYAHNLYLKEKLVTDLVIPNSVTSIWNNAFYNCSCLTSVTIGNSVTSIGSSAFHQCTSLKIVINNSALDIVKGSTNYGYVAYYAIDVYKGRDVIDDFVFSKKDETDYVVVYTGSDSQVTLPANYRGGSYGVAAYLFYNNTTVKSITLSNSVTSIGDYAFNGCSNLNVVYIGNSVISIGQEAFRNCPQLYKIIMLPNSVPSGINDAFSTLSGRITYVGNTNYQSGYDVLGTQRIYPNLNSYFTVDGIVYALSNPSKRTCDIIDCDYSGATTEFTIGNTVVYRNVTLSVDSININAFRNNQEMTKLTVNNMAGIGDYAFANCDKLNNVIIDDSVKNIGNYAFQSCSSLENVTIQNKGNIGTQAFNGSSTQNPATYIISNVGAIGESAFANCSKLQKAQLGNQIPSINQSAFSGCVLLDSITMPNTISSLGASAFNNCQQLAYVKLSNLLTSIGRSTFAGCSTLPELFIPKSVTSIGNGTFKGCSALSIVSFEDSSAPLSLGTNASNQGLFYDCHLDSLYIGRELNYPKTASDGYSPFYRNSSLRSIVISDFPTKVETNEFYGCTKLYSVYIGNGVQRIGDYAFSGCSSIDYFSFGNQVHTIGAEAFSDCVAMTRLYSYCQVPPTCGASALADIDKWNCTLYIPKGTASTYAAANQWMDFFFIEENEEGGEGIQYTISVDFDATKGTVTGAGVYNIGTEVILIATPAEGCTFVAWEDGSTNPERHIYAYKSETYTATFSAPNYELYNGNDIAVSGESTPKNIEIDRVSYPNAIAYSYSTTTDINLPDNICGQNNEGDWYADSIALIDAQPFYAPYDVEAKHLSYARTFENDQWQALYVPFDMQYADFSSKVRIAYVNNVHQYDDDDNGVIDRTVIEFISVVNDDIKANWPYIVKPNTAGAMTFNVANTTLHATEDNDVECQSAFTRFNIIGTYQNTPIINKYIVHNSEFELCESLQTVSPFRIYLVVTNKYPTSPQPAPMRVTFMIDGREEPAPTGVEMLYENDSTGETYDVLGRPVSHPSHGIFIRNGEKILVK